MTTLLEKNTLRYSIYAAVVTSILTLTGIFGNFAERKVIGETVNLSTILLIIVLGGTAYFMASRTTNLQSKIINGLAGGLVVGVALAILVFIEASVDLSFIFVSLIKNPIGKTLSFGLELVPGILLLLGISAAMGAGGGLLAAFPGRVQRVLILSLGIVTVVGVLVNQVNKMIPLPDALMVVLIIAISYLATLYIKPESTTQGAGIGLGIGIVLGIVLSLVANGGGLEVGGLLSGTGNTPIILGIITLDNAFVVISAIGIIGIIVIFLTDVPNNNAAYILIGLIVIGMVNGLSNGVGETPIILSMASDNALIFIAITGLLGLIGTFLTTASRSTHNSAVYLLAGVIVIGLLNDASELTLSAIVMILLLVFGVSWFTESFGERANAQFETLKRSQQRNSKRFSSLIALALLLILPFFAGQYITSVLDLVLMYIIMGIGLNVMIGYAGLLDLGYVAGFAIGAYSVGLLTTPSLITCGGIPPSELTPDKVETMCTGVLTFWQAWPLCFLLSGMVGVMLGIPVLRMRGDYLAIVTLGFGEIIRLLALSNDLKPLLGAAQGISPIPSPVVDLTFLNPEWTIVLGNATSIYYLFIASALAAAFVVSRLASTRLGRAWRAMRADEDVAEAMGIHLVRTKLLAFGISLAFAGLGGAIFGSWLQGTFPNSFTLMVSINVVSLIIIGGLGSIPGAVVGSLALIGMPELLRELQDYRLLAFGALLVLAMLLKPEGLIPPPIRRLSEMAAERKAEEGGYGD